MQHHPPNSVGHVADLHPIPDSPPPESRHKRDSTRQTQCSARRDGTQLMSPLRQPRLVAPDAVTRALGQPGFAGGPLRSCLRPAVAWRYDLGRRTSLPDQLCHPLHRRGRMRKIVPVGGAEIVLRHVAPFHLCKAVLRAGAFASATISTGRKRKPASSDTVPGAGLYLGSRSHLKIRFAFTV